MYLWANAIEPQALSAPNRPSATPKAILPVTRSRLVLMIGSARCSLKYCVPPARPTHASDAVERAAPRRPSCCLAFCSVARPVREANAVPGLYQVLEVRGERGGVGPDFRIRNQVRREFRTGWGAAR